MVEFNFKSQRATTIEQSERLIALGLRKETADMCHTPFRSFDSEILEYTEHCSLPHGKDIPAWSLHRIISMVYSSRIKKNGLGLAIIEYENPFEDMIRQIEWLIKEGYFNKEYLCKR